MLNKTKFDIKICSILIQNFFDKFMTKTLTFSKKAKKKKKKKKIFTSLEKFHYILFYGFLSIIFLYKKIYYDLRFYVKGRLLRKLCGSQNLDLIF